MTYFQAHILKPYNITNPVLDYMKFTKLSNHDWQKPI